MQKKVKLGMIMLATLLMMSLPFGGVFAEVTSDVFNQEAFIKASDSRENLYFGLSVALDGDTLVVGAPYDDTNGTRSGAAYVYERSGSTWTEQAKLFPSNPEVEGFLWT